MARYYRRRYTRVVKPKKKWATNVRNLATSQTQLTTSNVYSITELVANSSESSTPTPVIIKAGNFKTQLDVSYVTDIGTPVEVRTFILYVPEGMTINSYALADDTIAKHPEWIMGWKYASIDYANPGASSGTQTVQFSSRLKRNLNSGDKIICATLLRAQSTSAKITAVTVGGICQFWTCAN